MTLSAPRITALLSLMTILVGMSALSFGPAPYYWIALGLWVLLSYRVRMIRPLFLVLLFYGTFLPYLGAFVLGGIRISDYPDYQLPGLASHLLSIQIVFLTTALTFLTRTIPPVLLVDMVPRVRATGLGVILVAGIIAASFTFGGQNIFDAQRTYSAYSQNVRDISGLPEYLIFALLAAFILLHRTQMRYLPLLAVAVLFYQFAILGFRVQILMLGLLPYFFYCEKWFTPFRMICGAIVGFAALSAYGYMKGGDGHVDLVTLFFDDSRGFIISHQTGVLYSSMAIVGLIQEGAIDVADRAMSLAGVGINALVPSSLVTQIVPEYNWASLAQDHTLTAGGVLFTVAFYGWLSYIGPVICGLSVALVPSLSRLGASVWPLGGALAALFVGFPRWVSYDVGNFMLRMPIWIALAFLLLTIARQPVSGHAPNRRRVLGSS
jgi:hypothetical protein